MKISISILFVVLILFSCNSGSNSNQVSYDPQAEYIQVVLFHLKARCESCNAVEEVTEALLLDQYQSETDAGRIKFISLDIQSDAGRTAAEHLKATGQNLFVVKGNMVRDLSGEAFLFALTHPERYSKSLREELDKLLE